MAAANHVAILTGRRVTLDGAQRARDDAILEAFEGGIPVPVIAEAVGLTRGRVYQILKLPGNPYNRKG